MMMTNVERRAPSSTSTSTSSAAATLGAAVLIFLGIVFQLCELGYAHLTTDSHWVASLLLQSLWNVLDGWVNSAAIGDSFRFWPLALVLAGCAILMSRRTAR
ncbi:MAG TPA: hypothetical protein VHX49_09950 [Candidatus Acidoferrales bacterium]|nr:hypothetical protein [Candidatus Acidoferrales bacterium]